MAQRSIFSRSSVRIEQELQLQAELEFMLEVSKRIKQERNSLQIERLHLENLKLQLENADTSMADKKHSLEHLFKDSLKAAQSNMSAVDMMSLGSRQHKDDNTNTDDDIQCNNQDLNLNLNLTGSAFGTSKQTSTDYDYESDEDESSSELSDGDDVVIDMNMLMNGSAT